MSTAESVLGLAALSYFNNNSQDFMCVVRLRRKQRMQGNHIRITEGQKPCLVAGVKSKVNKLKRDLIKAG